MALSPSNERPDSSARQTPGPSGRSPWSWVPSLYLAEGLPYAVVMTVSVIMYKGLGLSNTEIALYTSWLYLPWVIKPLWSPVVDILKTRRLWIWVMQLVIGAGLAGVALTIPTSDFLRYTLAFLWLLAFSSATHDIAADGFYMLATTDKEQAFFVGIRSTFYRLATITGQGLLVMLAGVIQSRTGLPAPELEISASPGTALTRSIESGSVAFEVPGSAPVRVLMEPQVLKISPEPQSRAEISPLLASARTWNLDHGFVQPPQPTESTTRSGLGWWTRWVSEPVGQFLRRHFGPELRGKSDAVGNIGVAYLRLSKPPEKQIVVVLALKSGDKSIGLVEGARLIFNDQNWSQPALVVAQLDPKLRAVSAARYEVRSGDIRFSWTVTFAVLSGLFLCFGFYHRITLPHPAADRPGSARGLVAFLRAFFSTFGAFFRKERIGVLLLFLLFYRFAEAQLVKLVTPFLLDAREAGGLGLTTGQVGFVYGTVGIIALTCGGLLGGMLASRHGLKAWLWPMVFIMHLPDAMFIFLAYAQPDNLFVINLCVAVEQFGYGFGFTAYMLYMIYLARGNHETAHYAICTGFMALGMMLPGMFSGWLQDQIGYPHFFVWVFVATLPGFLVAALVPLDAEFGKQGRRA